MRVLYITSTAPYSAREAFLLPEIEELRNQGCSVRIIPLRPRGGVVHGDAVRLVPLTTREPLWSLRIAWAAVMQLFLHPFRAAHAATLLLQSRTLRIAAKNLVTLPKALWASRLAEKWGADHIHAQWGGCTATLALIASRVSGVQWSMTVHRWDIPENNLLSTKVQSAMFTRAIDLEGKREVEAVANGCNVVLLHVGVRIPPLTETFDRPVIGHFQVLVPAMLVAKKGHCYLIKAAKLLADRGVSIEIHCAGSGPLEGEIRSQVAHGGLLNSVKLLGSVPHDQLLQRMQAGEWDAVVIPSVVEGTEKEGIPVSLIEAMARSLPVVSTLTGGIPELLAGGAGMLVRERDPAALADAIEALVSNAHVRQGFGRRARARVEERFEVSGSMRRLIALMAGEAGRGAAKVELNPSTAAMSDAGSRTGN